MRLTVAPLVLSLILCGYWGRVLRMAHKARRLTGRAANLAPPEKIGRWTRLIWAPAVCLWVFLPMVTAFRPGGSILLRPLFRSSLIQWLGCLMAAACLALSVVCWRAMGRHWRMGIDPAEKTPLLDQGPFAVVRHPIYTLSILMMLASMAVIPSPLMLGVGAVHISLIIWESVREEHHLLRLHGQTYREYCQRVGRFLPGWTYIT